MEKIFIYIVIIISAVFHEYAHGWAAYRLGDSTAKRAGRLTLNPFVHLDLWGTVIIPLLLLFGSGIFIGWAKPVPYNPYNLKDQKYGNLKVAAAGPGINLGIALALGLLLRFSHLYINSIPFATPQFMELIAFIVFVNIFLALFNLIPIPPLDGSKILGDLYPRAYQGLVGLGFMGIFLALFIAFFFLSPIAQFIFRLIVGGFSFF